MATVQEQLEQLAGEVGEGMTEEALATEFQAFMELRKADKVSAGSDSGKDNLGVGGPFVSHHMPKISNFSGAADRKDEVPFDLWALEVRSLIDGQLYAPEVLTQAVRRSLRGQASRVLLHLGQRPTVADILGRLETIFGTVCTDASLLEQFYTEEQRDGEAATSWGSRLEDIVATLRERGKVSSTSGNEMLRNKFWTGLRSSKLKGATRHRFDTPSTFLELLAQVRAAEHEIREDERRQGAARKTSTTAKVHQATEAAQPIASRDSGDASVAAAVAAVQPMIAQVMALLERQATLRDRPSARSTEKKFTKGCFRCGGLDHFQIGCRAVLPEQAPGAGNGETPLPGSRQ